MPAPSLSRRRFLGAVGLALALAGCAPANGPAPAAGSGFPRVVRHEAGDTGLDRPPTRVLSVTDGAELGALLALGVTPIAFGQRNDPLLPWVAAAGGAAPAIQRFPLPDDVNFEQLAALRPDAIVGQYGFVTEETVATYSGIAPTVSTSFIDWRESLRQVAETTGTEDRARAVAADLDARVDAAAARVTGAAGTRVAIFSVYAGNEVYALNRASPAGTILDRLGFPPLPVQGTPGEAADPVSAELVGSVLDCDLALVQLYDDDRSAFAAARDAGLFDAVTAFRTGRVVELNGVDSQALYFSSVLTVPWALDVLTRVLPGGPA